MATLVMTTVGSLIGGPIGGAIGGLVGNIIDGTLLAPKAGAGPRLADLGAQLSGYGQILPRLYGTLRAAGSVVWSSGLRETAHRSGGKRTGGRRTTYSYSSSFAVALSARRINGIRRVWADGKLLRNSAGQLTAGGLMRVYRGSERQAPDPLIVAHEGMNAPAYRGVAYVVFEDLQLADFGNRVPNLTFEVDADGAPDMAVSEILRDIGQAVDVDIEAGSLVQRLIGFAAGRNATVRDLIGQLATVAPHDMLVSGANSLMLRARNPITPLLVPTRDLGADTRTMTEVSDGFAVEQDVRAETREVALSFFDPARDYQPGLQRARSPVGQGAGRIHLELSAVLEAAQAKALAYQQLLDRARSRRIASIRLPWRYAALAPGDVLQVADRGLWRVQSVVIEAMMVTCRLVLDADMHVADRIGDPGRANLEPDAQFSATLLHAFEAPPWTAALSSVPTIWLAACGAGPGWRGAEYQISQDGGESWTGFAYAEAGAVIGRALTALPDARADLWDSRNEVTVKLANADMWLESRTPSAVLGGANWAMLGSEMIAFQHAVMIAPETYRLSGLLRGMRGSEDAMRTHAEDEPFILLDPQALTALELPLARMDSVVAIRARGPGDGDAPPMQNLTVAGLALRPLSPVHLRARRLADDSIHLLWTRRSRNGFAWIDRSDAPLAEEREQYELRISAAGNMLALQVSTSETVIGMIEQTALAGGRLTDFTVEIVQLSADIGSGRPAMRHLFLP